MVFSVHLFWPWVLFSAIVFKVGYYIFIERLCTRFNPLQPLHCSIRDPASGLTSAAGSS